METRYLKYSKLSPEEGIRVSTYIYLFTRFLNLEYPNFDNWYDSLFENRFQLKKEREIIICQVDKDIAGVAILKKSDSERKICTLRVDRHYRHNGIGRHLMEMSFEVLEDEKPLITMHTSKYSQFSSLLKRYNFELEQRQKHYYSIFSTELVFNGILPEKEIALNRIELVDFYSLIQDFLKTGSDNFEQYINVFLAKCAERERNRYLLEF